MTCVMACVRDGYVHMAADSAVLVRDYPIQCEPCKVTKLRHYLIGLSGCLGDAQIVTQWFVKNAREFKTSWLFDGSLSEQLKKWCDARIPKDDRSYSILIASKRDEALYQFDDDFSTNVHPSFMSIGSGANEATIVWKTLDRHCHKRQAVKTKMFTILDLVAEHNVSVRRPFQYERL